MTIEEFTRDFEIGPLLLITFICTFALVMWTHNFKKKRLEDAKTKIYGLNTSSPISMEYDAVLLEKSVSQYTVHADWSISVNYCIFGLQNGQRVRLAIEKQSKYDLMTPGDKGILKYADNKFIDFNP